MKPLEKIFSRIYESQKANPKNSKTIMPNYNKRKRINILGISFTYKTKEGLDFAKKYNIEKNQTNLLHPIENGNKNILFVVRDLVSAGGLETRLLQYINQISSFGWNCYVLSENNENERLKNLPNFSLDFDATNFDECLNNIVEKYNISVIEFQFKNPKILKNLDLKKLKTKVRLGCVIHNKGITNLGLINHLDYKIMVSKFMYERDYSRVKNAKVIQNCIDTQKYKNKPTWTYKNQKMAILITRIDRPKVKSIECFIKYCKDNNIDFLIAGEEHQSNSIKQEIIKKFKLKDSIFIGKVDTIEYLSNNIDNILFVAGVGLVILEAAYLNYPCFCCSDSKGKSYSFVTDKNIYLFDNFTINKKSLVTQQNKKEFVIDTENINRYHLRQYIIDNRNLSVCIEEYINIIGDGNDN